jgi:hypothetical protein
MTEEVNRVQQVYSLYEESDRLQHRLMVTEGASFALATTAFGWSLGLLDKGHNLAGALTGVAGSLLLGGAELIRRKRPEYVHNRLQARLAELAIGDISVDDRGEV